MPFKIRSAISKKGYFMIRGHFPSKLIYLALFGAVAVAAQQPATQLAAAPAAALAAEEQPKITDTETVVVTASGTFRDQQELQSPVLLEEAPGTSPIESLAKLPSVNFQAADPYGSYEWAVRISVRGFNQNQLGFTLDDIPLGDMSYGNWNGLARDSFEQQPGRNHSVLLRRPLGQAQPDVEPDHRQLEYVSHVRAL